jgi:hypothetical protein
MATDAVGFGTILNRMWPNGDQSQLDAVTQQNEGLPKRLSGLTSPAS